jgi:regulator of sirC expression with transglutaminase-like and TPR domain
MHNADPFANEINRPTIDLPRAALVFARSIAFPALDVETYLARLDALAEAARPQVEAAQAQGLAERAEALSDFLFYQMNFRGARDNQPGAPGDYHNPENSFLNRVLDRRLGIPISLSLVYISVARRLGLSAYGIGLPGHFIVGLYGAGSEILIDPFNAGIRLTQADCGRLVRETTGSRRPFQQKWLAPSSPADLLARMLTNLCNAYVQRENWRSAIPVIQHLLYIQPEMDWHLRDLGYLYFYSGSLRLAAQYLDEYLRRAPEAPDFESVRSSLLIVAGRLALWN